MILRRLAQELAEQNGMDRQPGRRGRPFCNDGIDDHAISGRAC